MLKGVAEPLASPSMMAARKFLIFCSLVRGVALFFDIEASKWVPKKYHFKMDRRWPANLGGRAKPDHGEQGGVLVKSRPKNLNRRKPGF